MGCFVRLGKGGGEGGGEPTHQRALSAVACCSLLLLSASADARSADDVIAF